MNKEDKEHTYAEGNHDDGLAEYESYKGNKPQMSGMIKLVSIVLAIGVALLFIFLVAIIATTASIRHDLTTLPICNNSQAQASSLRSPNAVTGTGNCSQIIELLEKQQGQIGLLLDAAIEQTAISTNNTYHIEQVMQTTGNTAQKLVNIVNTLTNLKNTSTSTAGVVDDILLVLDELLELHSDNSTLPYSCAEIKQRQPNSPSGVYLLINPNGNGATYAYCHMGELCGSDGGWKRIAYKDMSDATQTCPSGFRLYQGARACGRPSSNSASCASVQFPSNGFSYSQICGRVTGYQFRFTDAVAVGWTGHNNLNSWYVDGVSITKGSPREHVWTFMAGHSGNRLVFPQYNCPCATGSTQVPQSFVGNNYFCESGNHAGSLIYYLLTSNPLWDGQNCGSDDTNCCSAPGIPWFHRTYSVATNDNLELRVCGDQGTEDEDVPFGYYEIYIK